MAHDPDFLWYIPNQAEAGHRGDVAQDDHNSLDTLTRQAKALEEHGWTGALLGTGWGRPDCFTVAAALAARTTTFEPLVAIRPGHWQPAQFASAAATLDHLTGGRLRVNVVSGRDDLAAYGDGETDPARRYARTAEFMRLVRRLWTEENVTFAGRFYQRHGIDGRAAPRGPRRPPPSRALFRRRLGRRRAGVGDGGRRPAVLGRTARRRAGADRAAAGPRPDPRPRPAAARVRIARHDAGARHAEEAWADAEAKVAEMARSQGAGWHDHRRENAVGQRRLLDLAARGDVLDDNLYTAPGRFGGGGAATTWLVGSAAEVARSLDKYRALGVTHFILSDTPYLSEIERQGRQLLPLLRGR